MGEIVTGLEFAASMASPGGKSQRHITEGIAEIERLQAVNADLVKALESALEWIDAVPKQTPLPTMPGFDRDHVDNILSRAKEQS